MKFERIADSFGTIAYIIGFGHSATTGGHFGTQSTSSAYRAMVEWDISDIPSTAVITSVKLKCKIYAWDTTVDDWNIVVCGNTDSFPLAGQAEYDAMTDEVFALLPIEKLDKGYFKDFTLELNASAIAFIQNLIDTSATTLMLTFASDHEKYDSYTDMEFAYLSNNNYELENPSIEITYLTDEEAQENTATGTGDCWYVSDASYSTVRTLTPTSELTGNQVNNFGQYYTGSAYELHRAVDMYAIPKNAFVVAARAYMRGSKTYSPTHDNFVQLRKVVAYAGAYADFWKWGELLGELDVRDWSVGDNYVWLNDAGCRYLTERAGSTAYLMMCTRRDFEAETPTGDEYLSYYNTGYFTNPDYHPVMEIYYVITGGIFDGTICADVINANAIIKRNGVSESTLSISNFGNVWSDKIDFLVESQIIIEGAKVLEGQLLGIPSKLPQFVLESQTKGWGYRLEREVTPMEYFREKDMSLKIEDILLGYPYSHGSNEFHESFPYGGWKESVTDLVSPSLTGGHSSDACWELTDTGYILQEIPVNPEEHDKIIASVWVKGNSGEVKLGAKCSYDTDYVEDTNALDNEWERLEVESDINEGDPHFDVKVETTGASAEAYLAILNTADCTTGSYASVADVETAHLQEIITNLDITNILTVYLMSEDYHTNPVTAEPSTDSVIQFQKVAQLYVEYDYGGSSYNTTLSQNYVSYLFRYSSSSWTSCRADTPSAATTYIKIGERKSPWYIYTSFINWNVSSIPSGATITKAQIKLTLDTKSLLLDGDFNILIFKSGVTDSTPDETEVDDYDPFSTSAVSVYVDDFTYAFHHKEDALLDEEAQVCLPMNEKSGTTLDDKTPNENDFTISSGAYWHHATLTLNGTTSQVALSGNPFSTYTDFTIALKLYCTGGTGTLRALISPASATFIHFQLNTSDKIEAFVYGPSVMITSDTVIENDTWYSVIITWEGKVGKMYVNKNLEDTTAVQASDPTAIFGTYYIGMGYTSSRFFPGIIKDVRIWSDAMSQSNVDEYEDGESFYSPSTLILDMPLDEGEGTTVYDWSASALTGTVTAGEWTVEHIDYLHLDDAMISKDIGVAAGATGLTASIRAKCDFPQTSFNLVKHSGNNILIHWIGAGCYLVGADASVSGYLAWDTACQNILKNVDGRDDYCGGWHTLTLTWDGTTMRSYVDKTKNTNELAFNPVGGLAAFATIDIGRYFNSVQSNFKGYARDFLFVTRWADDQEVFDIVDGSRFDRTVWNNGLLHQTGLGTRCVICDKKIDVFETLRKQTKEGAADGLADLAGVGEYEAFGHPLSKDYVFREHPMNALNNTALVEGTNITSVYKDYDVHDIANHITVLSTPEELDWTTIYRDEDKYLGNAFTRDGKIIIVSQYYTSTAGKLQISYDAGETFTDMYTLNSEEYVRTFTFIDNVLYACCNGASGILKCEWDEESKTYGDWEVEDANIKEGSNIIKLNEYQGGAEWLYVAGYDISASEPKLWRRLTTASTWSAIHTPSNFEYAFALTGDCDFLLVGYSPDTSYKPTIYRITDVFGSTPDAAVVYEGTARSSNATEILDATKKFNNVTATYDFYFTYATDTSVSTNQNVLVSRDGGNTFEVNKTYNDSNYSQIYKIFANDSLIYAIISGGSAYGAIVVSEDEGETWTVELEGSSSQQPFVIGGEGGFVYRTMQTSSGCDLQIKKDTFTIFGYAEDEDSQDEYSDGRPVYLIVDTDVCTTVSECEELAKKILAELKIPRKEISVQIPIDTSIQVSSRTILDCTEVGEDESYHATKVTHNGRDFTTSVTLNAESLSALEKIRNIIEQSFETVNYVEYGIVADYDDDSDTTTARFGHRNLGSRIKGSGTYSRGSIIATLKSKGSRRTAIGNIQR